MPRYEYECPCGAIYELDRHIVERDHDVKCVCGRMCLRQISAPAFKVEGYSAKNGYAEKANKLNIGNLKEV